MNERFVAGNRVELLRSGSEYFPALIDAINAAAREINLETYIFADDETGRVVAAALIAAVSRGVTVQLVIDGFGSKDHIGSLEQTLRAGGVLVRVFRPERNPFAFRKSRLRRMHRKLALIDQRVAFVGGINVIDDLNMPPLASGERAYGPRLDYAVKVEGALVHSIAVSMRVMWRRLHKGKPDQRFAEVARSVSTRNEAAVHVAAFVHRDNLLHRRDIESHYLQAFANARHEILIANAYFFPGRTFSKALNSARERGVRVRLLLQGRKEYFLQHYASRALYASLLLRGIEIYEYHDSFLHAKVAVVDDAWATVGSSNIDPFSLLLAREANVFVKDAGFTQELGASLEQAIAGARRVHGKVWSQRAWLDRWLTGASYFAARAMMRVLGYGDR
jgi:cardiolipin synthase A/B